MISSPYLPIRILVLDILDEALLCVEQFENELLPMIHQNWLGLIRAFDSGWQKSISDDGKLVAARAIRVGLIFFIASFKNNKIMAYETIFRSQKPCVDYQEILCIEKLWMS
jgi:hypothetical protein